jgi:FkbM family methyltransferase
MFVRNIGRFKFYDILKQGIKKVSPEWFISFVKTITRPYEEKKAWVKRRLEIKESLPPSLAEQFFGMLKEARKRWDRGNTEPTGEPFKLPVFDTGFSVWIRPGTCDVVLYYDIMIKEYYGKTTVNDVKVVIDCGANIGLTSVYLLYKYPKARLIALEPDPVNFDICKKNLENFKDRATVFQKAIWSTSCNLTLSSDLVGTWASNVGQCTDKNGEIIVEAVDLNTLMQEYDFEIVDMLKMDIEGAEEDIFVSGNLDWLDKVRCFQVELENDKTRSIVLPVLNDRGFELSQYKEITIAINRKFDR